MWDSGSNDRTPDFENGKVYYEELDSLKSFADHVELHKNGEYVIGEFTDISFVLPSIDVGTYHYNRAEINEANAVRIRSTPTATLSDHFSTSVSEKGLGMVTITEYDEVNHTVSGDFEHSLEQYSGLEETPLEIRNGRFEKLEIFEVNDNNGHGNFKASIPEFSPQGFAYRTYSPLDFGSYLYVSFAMPRGLRIGIVIPFDLQVGNFILNETQLGEIDKFQIAIEEVFGSGKYYIPSSSQNTMVEIKEFDLVNNIIELEINGQLLDEDGAIISLNNFELTVSDWEK